MTAGPTHTIRGLFYEVVSKIFRTGAAIYTAVVIARSTGPNRPNCEFRVLLWLALTAWKCAKTLPRTLARTDLAASPWQRPVSHFCPHPAVSGERQNDCHLPLTVLPRFGIPWLLPITKNEIEAERTPVCYHWGDLDRIAESAWHPDRKGLPGRTVGPVCTCGRELLRGWWRQIGLMIVRFLQRQSGMFWIRRRISSLLSCAVTCVYWATVLLQQVSKYVCEECKNNLHKMVTSPRRRGAHVRSCNSHTSVWRGILRISFWCHWECRNCIENHLNWFSVVCFKCRIGIVGLLRRLQMHY
jgi:hypothetical protein